MRKFLKCKRCNGYVAPQVFFEDKIAYVDGLECNDCRKRITTSTMTLREFRVMTDALSEEDLYV